MSRSKFKIGDKVRIISGYYDGSAGTIISKHHSVYSKSKRLTYLVKLGHTSTYKYSYELRKDNTLTFNSVPPKFKVGDRVIVNNKYPGLARDRIGEVGTITKLKYGSADQYSLYSVKLDCEQSNFARFTLGDGYEAKIVEEALDLYQVKSTYTLEFSPEELITLRRVLGGLGGSPGNSARYFLDQISNKLSKLNMPTYLEYVDQVFEIPEMRGLQGAYAYAKEGSKELIEKLAKERKW
jgi:hypothetical protein